MKKLIFGLLLLAPFAAFAQSPVSTRLASGLDVGIGFKKDNYYPSLSYYQLLHIDSKHFFSIGWTTKLAAFYGDNLNYYTAPARLTRGETGFGALGADLIPANIDTLRMDYATVTSVNFGLRAEVRLGPVELGGSADLLGLAFGRRRTAKYLSSTGMYASGSVDTLSFQGKGMTQTANPTRVNLRLLGDNDYGTLSSEVYARLNFHPRVGVKLGYQWLTTEYQADNRNIVDRNRRFRHRVGMPYVAVTFPFF